MTWTPPARAVKFLVWTQPRVLAFSDADDTEGFAEGASYGGAAPAWTEVGGFDITNDTKIVPDTKGAPLAGFTAAADGVTVTWAALLTLTQGLLTEVVQIIAYGANGRATQVDLYSVPAPSSTDASVIAAQERRVLQNLLVARDRATGTAGVKVEGGEDGAEFIELHVLDRRIAECRARVTWFEEAARGNTLVRAEFW